MPFSATVFNVLVASPSDVPDEREAIAASLHEWNALNAHETGQVLLPVMWESHCAPAMGDRPQGIVNDQIVKACDRRPASLIFGDKLHLRDRPYNPSMGKARVLELDPSYTPPLSDE